VAVVETASNESNFNKTNKVSDISKDSSKRQEKSENKEADQPINQSTSKLDNQWSALMSAVKPFNHSVEAVLRSCTGELKGKTLVIKPFYLFHKERLEEPKNLKILAEAAKKVYGKGIKVEVGPAEK